MIANPDIASILSLPDKSSFPDENDYWIIVNQKLRRSQYDPTLFEPNDNEKFPFADFAFLASNGKMNNYLVSKAVLEINFWTTNIDQAEELYDATTTVIKSYDEDGQIYYAGQRASGIANVYRFCLRYYPLLKS